MASAQGCGAWTYGRRFRIAPAAAKISLIEIAEGSLKSRKLELKLTFNEPLRRSPPPFQRKPWLRAQKSGPEPYGPLRSRRAPWSMQCPAQVTHEFCVRHRVRRGRVERSLQIVPLNCCQENSVHVRDVQPTDILFSIARAPAKSPSNHFRQHSQRSLVPRQDDPDPDCDFTRCGGRCRVERFLPFHAGLGQVILARRRALLAPTFTC